MAECPDQIGRRDDVLPQIRVEVSARERFHLRADRQHADTVYAQTRERHVHIATGKGGEFTTDNRRNLRCVVAREKRRTGSDPRQALRLAQAGAGCKFRAKEQPYQRPEKPRSEDSRSKLLGDLMNWFPGAAPDRRADADNNQPKTNQPIWNLRRSKALVVLHGSSAVPVTHMRAQKIVASARSKGFATSKLPSTPAAAYNATPANGSSGLCHAASRRRRLRSIRKCGGYGSLASALTEPSARRRLIVGVEQQ